MSKENHLRVIIAGGRDFNDINLLEEYFKGLQEDLVAASTLSTSTTKEVL